jgi:FKBP-type peptidyl-prolyl cis-trans isomerase SlyD
MEKNMIVAKNHIVTLAYQVLDPDGALVDEGPEPLQYLHGGYDQIFPVIESALDGKTLGDAVSVTMQPADSFGEYDPSLVEVVAVSDLPQPVTVGMQLEGNRDGAPDEESFIATVTEIEGDKAVVDGNHPLAGMILVFNCTVKEIRAATAEELAAHGIEA